MFASEFPGGSVDERRPCFPSPENCHTAGQSDNDDDDDDADASPSRHGHLEARTSEVDHRMRCSRNSADGSETVRFIFGCIAYLPRSMYIHCFRRPSPGTCFLRSVGFTGLGSSRRTLNRRCSRARVSILDKVLVNTNTPIR